MTPKGDHFKNCFLLAAVQVAQHRPEIFWLFINMSTCTVNWNMHFKILGKNGLFRCFLQQNKHVLQAKKKNKDLRCC
jgi:hypothetical protein